MSALQHAAYFGSHRDEPLIPRPAATALATVVSRDEPYCPNWACAISRPSEYEVAAICTSNTAIVTLRGMNMTFKCRTTDWRE